MSATQVMAVTDEAEKGDSTTRPATLGDHHNEYSTVPKQDGNADTGPEYVTGLKLFSLMIAVTLVSFLMLLDMSIIVTVRQN